MLKQFFVNHNKFALGFSGGVDSSYILYAAIENGVDVKPYYVKTAFQPQFELDDAIRFCENLNIDLTIIEHNILQEKMVIRNEEDRCYYCKKNIFAKIKEQANQDGYTVIADGTNASDDFAQRPGMRALGELSVVSPLLECGISKKDVRKLSWDAGLATWNKPAYSCLATRIATNTIINKEVLEKIEKSEKILFALGLKNFRVRVFFGAARIQLPGEYMELAIINRKLILQSLAPYFLDVLLDLKEREKD